MPDREKVIKELALVREHLWYQAEQNKQYRLYYIELDSRVNDAISLLKEQEEVEPEVEVLNEIDRLYKCPKCHKHFFYRKQRFCDQCGQAVNWNDL